MTFEKGHGKYIVESARTVEEAISSSGVPRLGESLHGATVTEIRVEALTRYLWQVSLTVDPVK